MKTVLTIAGVDPSGGAGIAADLKVIAAHGLYGMCAVTALTAQNTTGVFGVELTPPGFVARQMDAVFSDIFPDAVKIGMVGGAAAEIAASLQKWGAKNIVLDPLLVSSSGTALLSAAQRETLIKSLLPCASLLTPNLAEAAVLCGFPVADEAAQEKAARCLSARFHTAVLVKGGHLTGDAADVLAADGAVFRFTAPRVENPNSHGTGCTLSSAIACSLAAGKTLQESVKSAKAYLTGALRADLKLGRGTGPLNHLYAR